MDDITPEQLQLLIQLGIIPEEMAGVDEQMAQAHALRESPMPEGQMAGRVFVAPNPLQYAAAGMDRYRGMKEMKDLKEQRKGLLDKTTAGRMEFAKMLELLRSQQPSQPAQPQMPPNGPAQTFPVQ